MRIVILDLHCNDFFMLPAHRIMTGYKVKSYKHQFLLRCFFDNNIEVVNLITEKGTSVTSRYGIFTRNFRWARKLESYIVEKKNKLQKIKVISLKDIKKDDVLVGYLVYPYQLPIMSNVDCYKMMFGNHFVSINSCVDLASANVNAFVNEIDLSDNAFVNKFINLGHAEMLMLPYIFSNRFEKRIKFQDRLNKVMAVGTASTCEGISGYNLYRELFGTEKIQLMRWEILEKKDDIKEWIDCYIGDIRYKGIKKEKPKNAVQKLIRKFKSPKTNPQADYTTFDMVETFNKYKMFVCPEELVGMPGIGAIEGMACGTAYIGIDHEMYKCLGLLPGVHYIAYDGTLEGLISTIKECQKRPDDVERIAKAGMEYVREHFNEQAIQDLFMKQFKTSYDNYLKTLN